MVKKEKKQRIDVLLFERNMVSSRSLAQRMVMAGQVRVNGEVVIKPATKVAASAELIIDKGPKYASRGGGKLEGAFEAFELDVNGRVCADAGASTGGFTDCLLQNRAAKVYALDVGYGILDWKLRNDPRVVVMERTNVRYVKHLPEAVSFVTVDVSFISLKLILPAIKGWFGEEGGEAVVLIKPQFEAGRAEVSKGDGVIRKSEIHRRVLEEILFAAEENGFRVKGVIQSPLQGPKGNIEFLAWLGIGLKGDALNTVILAEVIDGLMPMSDQDADGM